jgi:hypothetical protein
MPSQVIVSSLPENANCGPVAGAVREPVIAAGASAAAPGAVRASSALKSAPKRPAAVTRPCARPAGVASAIRPSVIVTLSVGSLAWAWFGPPASLAKVPRLRPPLSMLRASRGWVSATLSNCGPAIVQRQPTRAESTVKSGACAPPRRRSAKAAPVAPSCVIRQSPAIPRALSAWRKAASARGARTSQAPPRTAARLTPATPMARGQALKRLGGLGSCILYPLDRPD